MDRERKNPVEVAEERGLIYQTTGDIIDGLIPQILMSCYRENPKDDKDERINEKVRKAMKEQCPNIMNFDDLSKSITSTFLHGPPGHGKTTAFKEASKKAAQLMGMDFLDRFESNPKIDENTFVFVSEEFSGETNKHGVGGIPGKKVEKVEVYQEDSDKKEMEEVEYMVHLMPRRIAMLQQAGGGLLLLDDFTNASPTVQNIGLSLAEEKRYQSTDIGNAYVALTGNLGAVDGTNTSKASSALLNRVVNIFTQDTVDDFRIRTEKKYNDKYGDMGVLGFLERNEHLFAQFPDSKQTGPYATPRSWNNLIERARYEAMKVKSPEYALKSIKEDARSMLGEQVGSDFAAYYYALLQMADPLARKCIIDGEINKEEVQKRYGEGMSSDNTDFAHQYSTALADYAVRRIVSAEDQEAAFDETMKRFAIGTLAIGDNYLGFAIDHMKRKLANQSDFLSQDARQDKQRKLRGDIKMKAANIFNADPNCTGNHLETLINSITDYDKFHNTQEVENRQSLGKRTKKES